MRLYEGVDYFVILKINIFYQNLNKDYLKEHLFDIYKRKINEENDKIEKIIISLDYILKKRKINYLNENEINMMKKIIELNSFSPLTDEDFFQNYFTEKESFFLKLQSMGLINNEKLKSIKFIKLSIQYLNIIKESLENKKMKINRIINFNNIKDKELFNLKKSIIENNDFSIFNDNNFYQFIINNLKEIEEIKLKLLVCENIRNEFFSFCNSFKYTSSLNYLNEIIENSSIEIFDTEEFKNNYNQILNFFKEINKLKPTFQSLIF